MEFYMVLDDGETYSNVTGCKLIAVEFGREPESIDQYDGPDLDEAIKSGHPDIVTITTFK